MSPDKPWIMEVRVQVIEAGKTVQWEWKGVKLSGAREPYSYATEDEAWKMLRKLA